MTGHLHSHSADPARRSGRRTLAAVLALTALFTAVEFIGGLLTESLALLADAGHMLSDVGSLILALVALWLADRPPSAQRSFGYKRAEILAALANGVALVAISVLIVVEAIGRFSNPPDVIAGWMLVVASAGLAVNIFSAGLLRRAKGDNLNMRAAFWHVIGDLLGSAGAIVAALVILASGWLYIDPIVSIVIALLILVSSGRILRDSLSILLEAAPRGIDVSEVGERMASVEGVVEVHDLHIWTITSGLNALSAHVLVSAGVDCHERRRAIAQLVEQEFGIHHVTLQVAHADSGGLIVIDDE